MVLSTDLVPQTNPHHKLLKTNSYIRSWFDIFASGQITHHITLNAEKISNHDLSKPKGAEGEKDELFAMT